MPLRNRGLATPVDALQACIAQVSGCVCERVRVCMRSSCVTGSVVFNIIINDGPVKRNAALLVDINGVIDPGTQTSCVGIENTGKPENVNHCG